jgi:hypothetical protein
MAVNRDVAGQCSAPVCLAGARSNGASGPATRGECRLAKKAKEAAKGGVEEKDLKRIVKEAVRQKNSAKEYASSAGGYIRNQIDKHGLEKTAFGWVCKLEGMEAQRKHEIVRCFLDYAAKAGVFDQMDMFDDTATTIEAIKKTLGKSKGPRPADEAIEELTQH